MNLESFFFKDEDPTEEKEELPDTNGAADTETSAPVVSEPETAPVEAPSAVEPEYNIVIHTMTDGPADTSSVTLPPSSFSCNLSEDLVPLPSGAVINTGDAVLEPKELIITSNPPRWSANQKLLPQRSTCQRGPFRPSPSPPRLSTARPQVFPSSGTLCSPIKPPKLRNQHQ